MDNDTRNVIAQIGKLLATLENRNEPVSIAVESSQELSEQDSPESPDDKVIRRKAMGGTLAPRANDRFVRRVHFYLEEDQADALAIYCTRQHTTQSAFIAGLVVNALKRAGAYEPEQPINEMS